MRTLVTGATGFIGISICRALLEAGVAVTAAVRAMPAPGVAGCEEVAVGDIDGATNWSSALDRADAVVHLAARTHAIDTDDSPADYLRVNVDGTNALARAAAAAGVRRFVYMSSIKVNGEHSPLDHDGLPQRMSGDHAGSPTTDYGRTKWAAEKLLHEIAAESAMAVVILRPPLVYGPGQKANMRQLLRLVDKRIPLPLSNIHNCRSLLYVENLAAAVICALNTPTSGIRTYTLADVDLSSPALIRALASALGKRAALFPLPMWLLALLARLARRSDELEKLTGSLIVERQHIADELGWSPPYAFEQALAETVAAYQVSGTKE